MTLVLLIGGARSGKSELAVRVARGQRARVAFVATAEAGDEEMRARIAAHARERPSGWRTIEEPLALAPALAAIDGSDCVIIDCLTLWTANALAVSDAETVLEQAAAAAQRAAARSGLTIAVTNEVGLGIVPDNPLGRGYRDLLGRVNATWARAADRAYLVVAGRSLALAPADELIEDLA
jgi:adenosyl cobinamide kinase/adenosyl cobinamide phosphate guanylyltransferase